MSDTTNSNKADDLTAERAAISMKKAKALTAWWYKTTEQWRDEAAKVSRNDWKRLDEDIAAALTETYQTARQEALREAASKLGIGDSSGLLEAPCLWCCYNGEDYYQAGTHGQSCPWNTIGGCDERRDSLAREGVK